MKKLHIMFAIITVPLMTLVIMLSVLTAMPVQAAPPIQPLYAPGDCMVTNTNDNGPGSLRQCILGLQSGATITFSTSVFPVANPATITLTTPLPEIYSISNVTIDGSNAGVILVGDGTPAGTSGLAINNAISVSIKGLRILNFPENGIELKNGASHNTIGGINATPGGACSGECNLISSNGEHGILIADRGTMSNTVSGNYIGTDVSGTTAVPNGESGVGVCCGASHNIIGGDTPEESNVISGNAGGGVGLFNGDTNYNVISGNYVGTDANGVAAIPNNSRGIDIWDGASHNTVGGTTPGERNIISGNIDPIYAAGVWITGAGTMSNTVIGNYIGTNASGTAALGNGGPDGGAGITIQSNASQNIIGGDIPEERNLISGNDGAGVQILFDTSLNTISGNYIGTDVSGTVALSNDGCGVQIGQGSSNNIIGGDNDLSDSACTGECNLISGNTSEGVGIDSDSGRTQYNVVSGNYIGTDVNGTSAIANGVSGVYIRTGASYNTIGGNTPAKRNLISGNQADGVSIGDGNSNHNSIIGNYIGPDVSGNYTLGNAADGVRVWGEAQENIIGGAVAGEGNLISGNAHWGVDINGSGSMSNTVVGNLIGTNASGTGAMANGFSGVGIRDGAQENTIGGDTSGTQNTIAFNIGDGVQVADSTTLRNTITRNAIHANGGRGIDLVNGGNTELAAPEIVTYNLTAGTVTGTACALCTIEVYSDDDDEGRVYEGTTTADADGDWSFAKGSPLTGPKVTATATDQQGNTSEFGTLGGPYYYVYLPIILKNEPPVYLYVNSINTGGIDPLEVRDPNKGNALLLSCVIGNNVTEFCGTFPAIGTYRVVAYTANCGKLGPTEFSDAMIGGTTITRTVICN